MHVSDYFSDMYVRHMRTFLIIRLLTIINVVLLELLLRLLLYWRHWLYRMLSSYRLLSLH